MTFKMPSSAGWLLVSAASTWHSPGYGPATRDDVLRRFGEPDSSKITGPTKEMSYQKIGVLFYLEQEVVYMLGIHDPKWAH
jgi:hypothetical protein